MKNYSNRQKPTIHYREERQGPMIHDKKRLIAVVGVLFMSLATASASDVAQFVNLGFSPDSRTFMFAQHGINDEHGTPYADIYTVDVPRNTFVRNGVVSEEYDVDISPGQDGSGALFSLLPEVSDVIARYRINHLRQGRLIYLFVNGEEQPATIRFRDFDTGDRYTIAMTQTARDEGAEGSAAFYLDVTVQFNDGTTVERQVGRPDYYRDGVNHYRIKQVIVSPDESSLVTVIERISDTDDGQRIRYMVETARLR